MGESGDGERSRSVDEDERGFVAGREIRGPKLVASGVGLRIFLYGRASCEWALEEREGGLTC